MEGKTKQLAPVILLTLGISILINVGCSLTNSDNSVEPVITRETLIFTQTSPAIMTQENTPVTSTVESGETINNIPASSTAQSEITSTLIFEATETPTQSLVSTISAESEENFTTTTLTPSPIPVKVNTDSIEWKVAIPHVTDSCQFTIADSSGDSFILLAETPPGSPIFCRASWSRDGEALAITSNEGIEIVNLISQERHFFENPLLAQQITENKYSYLSVAYDSWSKYSKWLEALASVLTGTSPLETYQTVIFNTLSNETISFEEEFRFETWSPVNENEFAYISLESDGGSLPGVYNVGIWDIVTSKPISVVEGLSEQYNPFNSKLILSPDGRYAVLDVRERSTTKDVVLILDFQKSSWEVLFEEPLGLIPWSWSTSGDWIGFYNSNGLHFGSGWRNGSPTITTLNMGGAFPIGWLPSEDIFFYEHNQMIYALDPNQKTSSTLLLDLTDINANIDQYAPVAFWAERISN